MTRGEAQRRSFIAWNQAMQSTLGALCHFYGVYRRYSWFTLHGEWPDFV